MIVTVLMHRRIASTYDLNMDFSGSREWFENLSYMLAKLKTTQHLFFRGRNYFGRDGGERARPLNIYFFKVVIILGEMEMRAVVRGPDHSTFIFSRS